MRPRLGQVRAECVFFWGCRVGGAGAGEGGGGGSKGMSAGLSSSSSGTGYGTGKALHVADERNLGRRPRHQVAQLW